MFGRTEASSFGWSGFRDQVNLRNPRYWCLHPNWVNERFDNGYATVWQKYCCQFSGRHRFCLGEHEFGLGLLVVGKTGDRRDHQNYQLQHVVSRQRRITMQCGYKKGYGRLLVVRVRLIDQRLDRVLEFRGLTVFALICGEIKLVLGREEPRFAFEVAADHILGSDIIVNPTHDRMSNAGTLHAKRIFLSQRSSDNRDRIYVSCSNWQACGWNGRVQRPSPTLHTVYQAGKQLEYVELAGGTFGVVYRRWYVQIPPGRQF